MSKSKVSEYLEKEPIKCAIIGITIAALLGLVGYKIIKAKGCKSEECQKVEPKKPEEEIKTVEVTPGAPSDSDGDSQPQRKPAKSKHDSSEAIKKDTLSQIIK